MKVSKFFRYFISILSILAVVLGILYFALYYSVEEFKSHYGELDDLVMNTSWVSVILTEIVNIIFFIIKDCMQTKQNKQVKHYIKENVKVMIPVLLIGSISAFVIGADAFYMQIAILLLNIMFFISGDMIEYGIIEVETSYDEEI